MIKYELSGETEKHGSEYTFVKRIVHFLTFYVGSDSSGTSRSRLCTLIGNYSSVTPIHAD